MFRLHLLVLKYSPSLFRIQIFLYQFLKYQENYLEYLIRVCCCLKLALWIFQSFLNVNGALQIRANQSSNSEEIEGGETAFIIAGIRCYFLSCFYLFCIGLNNLRWWPLKNNSFFWIFYWENTPNHLARSTQYHESYPKKSVKLEPYC